MGKQSLAKYLNGQDKREVVEYAWDFGIYAATDKYAPNYNPETMGRWLNEVTDDPEFVYKATKNSVGNLPIHIRIVDELLCRHFKAEALVERLEKRLAFIEEQNTIYKKKDKEDAMKLLKMIGGNKLPELCKINL